MSNSSEKQLDLFDDGEELFTISVPDGDVTIDVDYNYADDLFPTVGLEDDYIFQSDYQFVETGLTDSNGDSSLDNDRVGPEMGFAIEKSTVTAKSRALKAEYTLELAQDLKAIHGLLEPTPYKFREDELIDEFIEYIDSTYAGHYGHGGLQSFEIIVDRGHGMGFTAGNIDKYNDRYGKKGNTPDEWRKDIMKTIHYAFLKLYEHDRLYGTPDDE